MRYYSPAQGRFVTKDPIEEQGGLNLYAFCGNNGVNKRDYLGMDGDDPPPSDTLYVDNTSFGPSPDGYRIGAVVHDYQTVFTLPTFNVNETRQAAAFEAQTSATAASNWLAAYAQGQQSYGFWTDGITADYLRVQAYDTANALLAEAEQTTATLVPESATPRSSGLPTGQPAGTSPDSWLYQTATWVGDHVSIRGTVDATFPLPNPLGKRTPGTGQIRNWVPVGFHFTGSVDKDGLHFSLGMGAGTEKVGFFKRPPAPFGASAGVNLRLVGKNNTSASWDLSASGGQGKRGAGGTIDIGLDDSFKPRTVDLTLGVGLGDGTTFTKNIWEKDILLPKKPDKLLTTPQLER